MQKDIDIFIKHWFAQFDVLADETEFLPYLAEDITMHFPEGTFVGHNGFFEWYKGIKKMIKPNNKHIISNIRITKGENHHFEVQFNSRLIAEGLDGNAIDMEVIERWEMEIIKHQISIKEYKVMNK